MPHAKAYYPRLSHTPRPYCTMCPLDDLRSVASKGLVSPGFLRKLSKGAQLKNYLQEVAKSKTPVSAYALRIGGRTWNITQGLDRQFVDYLGTWKSPEASARYYRERPGSVLRKITRFYTKLEKPKYL